MKSSSNVERSLSSEGDPDEVSDFIDKVARVAQSVDCNLKSHSGASWARVPTEPRHVQPKVVIPPRWKHVATMPRTFVALQAWEGVVEDVVDDEIFVRLFDLTRKLNPEVTTSFSSRELDEEDLQLALPGAVFYWNVGYAQSPSGIKRESVIRFRRLPAWSRRDFARARMEAQDLAELFKDEQ